MRTETELVNKIEELNNTILFIAGNVPQNEELDGDKLTYVNNLRSQVEIIEWILELA